MKILQIVPNTNRESGGPVETLIQGSKVIIELGHEVEVVSMDCEDSDWFDTLPFKVIPLGPSKTAWGYSKNLLPWLKANVQQYDAVIVRGLWMYHLHAAWKALHKTNIPYFVFTHGMLDPWFKKTYPFKHLKKHLFWHWAEYPALRDAKGVLFTTEQEKILARESFKRYKCNEIVVNYGTAKPDLNKEEVKSHFLDSFPELRGKELYLYLSRIHPKKGCDLLIKAFAKVARINPNAQLVMAGPDHTSWIPKLKEIAIKEEISDRITWTGMLKDENKWGAYYASKVFCLTSHQENFGIVVAEAMACGLPVLITKQVNIWYEVEDAKAGYVSTDDQLGADENLLKWNDTSSEMKTEMSLNAVFLFEEKFEINNAIKSLVKVLEV